VNPPQNALFSSISRKPQRRSLSYSGEDDDRLPLAMPGDD